MATKAIKGNTARVVGYIRCSTDEQQLGPEAQRAALVRWCEANGAQLVAVHEDLGVSGGADLDKRLGLLAAVDGLVTHGAGVLLVAKRDRLARDTMIAAMVERLALRNGATIQSADGAGNGTGPEAQLMRGMIDCFAQYERAIIRARTKSALAVKSARGERVGAVPYGAQLAADGRHLVPCEAEQAVIAIVKAYRSEGLTIRQVVARLDASGMFPRNGGQWHATQISRMSIAS